MSDIVVRSAAMITPVGLDTAQTASSVRADVSLFRCPDYNHKPFRGYVTARVPDDCLEQVRLPDLTTRENRLLTLASALRSQLPFLESREAGFVLGLPDTAVFGTIYPKPLLNLFLSRISPDTACSGGAVIRAGRASGLQAVVTACDLIEQGKARQVLAIGVDSFLDPDVLGRLNTHARTLSRVNRDGFIPGEGAGALVLTTRSEAEKQNCPILGRIHSRATGMEPGHLESSLPNHGDGLADTFRAVLEPAPEPVRTVYTTQNGETLWAQEWGTAFIRYAPAFVPEPDVVHPSENYGDAGAASGPVMAGIALTAAERGYRPGPALVYASSDTGERAAIIIDT